MRWWLTFLSMGHGDLADIAGVPFHCRSIKRVRSPNLLQSVDSMSRPGEHWIVRQDCLMNTVFILRLSFIFTALHFNACQVTYEYLKLLILYIIPLPIFFSIQSLTKCRAFHKEWTTVSCFVQNTSQYFPLTLSEYRIEKQSEMPLYECFLQVNTTTSGFAKAI